MRIDIQDSVGLNPVRPSASTQTQSTTSSSAMGSLSMVKPGAMGANTAAEFGQEVEVHNLLVIDQHTFEGEVTDKFYCQSYSCHIYINQRQLL
jgi:DNA damage-binding protein 1